MSTDLDAVIKNVAKENGVGLYKDDPVMVLVTIINQLTEDQRTGVIAALEKYREVHADMAFRWQTDAAKAANKILNAALDAGRVEMAKGMSAGAAQVVQLVKEATNASLAEQRKAGMEIIRKMQWYVILMLAGTGAAMAGMVVLMTLRVGG